MIRAWQRLVRGLERTESGASMAVVRVLTGACVIRTVLAVWWAGAFDIVWQDAAQGGYRRIAKGPFLVEWLGGPDAGLTWALFLVTLGAAALVTAGVGGPILYRLLVFTTLQAFTGLVDLNPHAGGSYDELLENVLWLLCLLGPTRTWSVDCRLQTGRWASDAPVMFWPRLLVVFQAVLMYATTGLQKVSFHWVPGGDLSALYYILQQPTWQHRDNSWVAWVYPLTQIGTLVTWTWEVGAPLWGLAFIASVTGRWPRLVRWRVREVFFALGLLFHLTVALMMDIGSFTWASLCLYPAFVHPHEWRALWDRTGGPTSGPADLARRA
jgi:hypothetical protein